MIILVQILKKEWELTKSQIELLGSLYYVGLFIGAIVSGFLCDKFGRRKSIIFGNIIQLITVLWTAVATNYEQMIFIRTLYGFVIGLTLPIGIILITEITPKHIRGRALVVI